MLCSSLQSKLLSFDLLSCTRVPLALHIASNECHQRSCSRQSKFSLTRIANGAQVSVVITSPRCINYSTATSAKPDRMLAKCGRCNDFLFWSSICKWSYTCASLVPATCPPHRLSTASQDQINIVTTFRAITFF